MQYVPFIPPMLPQEHYLSRLARLMVMTPSKSFEAFQRETFGDVGRLNPQRVYQPMYDSLITYMSDLDRERMFLQHTNAGFYSHFLPYGSRRTLSTVPKRSRPAIPFVHGLTKFRYSDTWKSCPLCIEQDIREHGTPYWRVSHQLPTSVTCYRHQDQTLIAECPSCGWKNTDLRNSPLPTTHCPSCSQNLAPLNFEHNPVTRWLQKSGLELQWEANSLVSPQFEYLMTREVEKRFVKLVKDRQQQSWQIAEKLQTVFLTWFRANGLERLFVDLDDKGIARLFSLEATSRTPRKVSPMSHLLWLAFFLGLGKEHVALPLAS